MDNRALATEIHEFLIANDALGHLGGIEKDYSIEEIENHLSDPQMIDDVIKDIDEIADTFDDHQSYITDVEPLLRGLRQIKEGLEAEQSRRMVADTGYEVIHAIRMGDREVLIAVNMKDPDGNFYMKAEYTDHGIIGQYDGVIYSPSYLCIVEDFVSSLYRQTLDVRNELVNYDPNPITADQCYPHDYGQDLTGKIVAIKAEALRPEYRRGDVQMVLVDSGFGAKANARGSAVFCYHLSDGKHTRFERHDVLGVVKELPDWAKERLAVIRAEREAAKQPHPAAPEKVSGYTITERIQVGQKQFVLGENPNAVSPYVTWQHLEGRTGYDWGHYFGSRDKALVDLTARAEKERYSTSPDNARMSKNRNDAR